MTELPIVSTEPKATVKLQCRVWRLEQELGAMNGYSIRGRQAQEFQALRGVGPKTAAALEAAQPILSEGALSDIAPSVQEATLREVWDAFVEPVPLAPQKKLRRKVAERNRLQEDLNDRRQNHEANMLRKMARARAKADKKVLKLQKRWTGRVVEP